MPRVMFRSMSVRNRSLPGRASVLLGQGAIKASDATYLQVTHVPPPHPKDPPNPKELRDPGWPPAKFGRNVSRTAVEGLNIFIEPRRSHKLYVGNISSTPLDRMSTYMSRYVFSTLQGSTPWSRL